MGRRETLMEMARTDLVDRFGHEVAELVRAVSDDPTIEDEAERRTALRRQVAQADDRVSAVFAADKVSKARELRGRIGSGRFERGDRASLAHYEASLEMLGELLPEHPLVVMLRAQLDDAVLAGSE